ncbi:MAG: Shikimate kinase 1 [Candidatus Anoxychlamydiales bacterium]|nr:Shikimate kinase 1 [Candidatus Anoxychlamydiales bacterium]
MNIILIGMKHSGKSSVGKTLSAMLDRKFFDIDEIIKTLFYKNYPKNKNVTQIFEIFKFLKEEKFRALEEKAFFSIKNVKNSVIAAAGGSILNENNFEFLKNSKIIIYLKTSIDTLKKRIFLNKKKSIFQDEKFLIKTFENREILYEKLADITIQTDDKDIQEIAFDTKNKIDQINHLKKIKTAQVETKYLYV